MRGGHDATTSRISRVIVHRHSPMLSESSLSWRTPLRRGAASLPPSVAGERGGLPHPEFPATEISVLAKKSCRWLQRGDGSRREELSPSAFIVEGYSSTFSCCIWRVKAGTARMVRSYIFLLLKVLCKRGGGLSLPTILRASCRTWPNTTIGSGKQEDKHLSSWTACCQLNPSKSKDAKTTGHAAGSTLCESPKSRISTSLTDMDGSCCRGYC